MEKIDSAVLEIREMDELSGISSPIHSLHPLSKLIVTVAYILFTVSFHKYNLTGLIVMVLYPLIMFGLSTIPVRTCFHKMRYVIPLVCAVGLFNPFFDRAPAFRIGSFVVSYGVVSMITLMLKGVFCLMASFLLVATTKVDELCSSMRKLYVPNILVVVFLLTYRYLLVIMEEVSVMTTAYKLRAPNQKGIHFSAWGSFLGQLLLRSMDRAEDLYDSMRLRGFNGEFRYAEAKKAKTTDWIFVVLMLGIFALCRFCNIAEIIGNYVLKIQR